MGLRLARFQMCAIAEFGFGENGLYGYMGNGIALPVPPPGACMCIHVQVYYLATRCIPMYVCQRFMLLDSNENVYMTTVSLIPWSVLSGVRKNHAHSEGLIRGFCPVMLLSLSLFTRCACAPSAPRGRMHLQ